MSYYEESDDEPNYETMNNINDLSTDSSENETIDNINSSNGNDI